MRQTPAMQPPEPFQNSERFQLCVPSTAAEAGELIQRAAEQQKAIYPFGSGHEKHSPWRPYRDGLLLSTKLWSNIIDYPARDMTITVQAGMTISQLRHTLAQERQSLPIDVPFPEQFTVGEILAVNISGSRRFSQGTLRDYLLGIKFLSDQGKPIQGGGRVVKNVAGYDMMKMHLGARGTLGVITEATFKVKPIPTASRLVSFSTNLSSLGLLLDLLHESEARPDFIDVIHAKTAEQFKTMFAPQVAASPGYWTILLGFENSEANVSAQLSQLQKDLHHFPVHDYQVFEQPDYPMFLQQIRYQWAGTGKSVVLPSQTASLLNEISHWPDLHGLFAHAGNGVIYFGMDHSLPSDAAAKLVSRLREKARHTEICHVPKEWSEAISWGPEMPNQSMFSLLKATLDPHNLFNPDRYWPLSG